MGSDLYAELNDASTTALEIIRRQRAGDVRGIVDLVGTYSDGGKGGSKFSCGGPWPHTTSCGPIPIERLGSCVLGDAPDRKSVV